MSETAASPPAAKLDDVMLAMDIVDTLRHRERIIDRELSADAREAQLIERLSEIYKAQGIDVPDRILRDGVQALEEKRFVYEPKTKGFSIWLAKLYISRRRWLAPLMIVLAIATFVSAAYEFGVEAPRRAKAHETEIALSQTLPEALQTSYDAASEIAVGDYAKAQIAALLQTGREALRDKSPARARSAIDSLGQIQSDLEQSLTIQIVSRPGEFSGVFRNHDDNLSVRNYYLIAEAVTARGEIWPMEIASEEDGARRRVERWGVRVSEAEFNRVAADKQDDQIIQNRIIGEKPAGYLAPRYSVSSAAGAILDW